jgi:hypothetical protein
MKKANVKDFASYEYPSLQELIAKGYGKFLLLIPLVLIAAQRHWSTTDFYICYFRKGDARRVLGNVPWAIVNEEKERMARLTLEA